MILEGRKRRRGEEERQKIKDQFLVRVFRKKRKVIKHHPPQLAVEQLKKDVMFDKD